MRRIRPAAAFVLLTAGAAGIALTGCAAGDASALRGDLLRTQDELTRAQIALRDARADLTAAERSADLLRDQLTGGGAVVAEMPEQARLLGRVQQLTVSKLLTGGLDRDGVPGDELLAVVLAPADADGQPLKAPGSIALELVNLAAKKDERQIGAWSFDAAEAAEAWRSTVLGAGYRFRLPLPPRSARSPVRAPGGRRCTSWRSSRPPTAGGSTRRIRCASTAPPRPTGRRPARPHRRPLRQMYRRRPCRRMISSPAPFVPEPFPVPPSPAPSLPWRTGPRRTGPSGATPRARSAPGSPAPRTRCSGPRARIRSASSERRDGWERGGSRRRLAPAIVSAPPHLPTLKAAAVTDASDTPTLLASEHDAALSSAVLVPNGELPADAADDLRNAVEVLEYRGMLRQLSDALGAKLERAIDFLPDIAQGKVEEVTQASLEAALNVAVKTMDKKSEAASWDLSHKLAGAAVGMVGGAFGLPSALIELPLSTTVMLRSVADIARANGEDLSKLETRLECLNVFALGGGPAETDGSEALGATDDGYDSAYFATRVLLAQEIGAASQSIAARGLADDTAGPVVKFLAKIASRYGVTVSEKMAAMAVPILGAAAGAAINVAFTSHFQSVARAHFSVRRLEREHGKALVEREYLRMAQALND